MSLSSIPLFYQDTLLPSELIDIILNNNLYAYLMLSVDHLSSKYSYALLLLLFASSDLSILLIHHLLLLLQPQIIHLVSISLSFKQYLKGKFLSMINLFFLNPLLRLYDLIS